MPRRSLQEDLILVGALHLHVESGLWGSADIPDATELITGHVLLEGHVVHRALRKFKRLEWVTAERDPDTTSGPRLLYELTEDAGIPVALAAAGRELAAGKIYPLPVLSAFGATALGQSLFAGELDQRDSQ